jgi:8-oxo-dGTP diphosphatase
MKTPLVLVSQGLIVHPKTHLVLMAHRPPGKKKPLMWEYPGGKLEPGETSAEALKRELKEELDIDVVVGELLAVSPFFWKERVSIDLFAIKTWSGTPMPLAATELRWVDPSDAIDNLPMLPGAFSVYREVMEYLDTLP